MDAINRDTTQQLRAVPCAPAGSDLGSSGSTQGPHTTAFLCHLDPLQSQDFATFTVRLSTRPLHVWKDTFPPTNNLVSTCLHFYSCRGHRSHPGVTGAEGAGQQEGSTPQRHCCTHPSPTSDELWKRQQAACPKSTVHLSLWFPCLPGALTASCSGGTFPLGTTCCSAALLRSTRAPVSSLRD